MPRIRISGPALAYAKSPKAKKPITDSLTLARFHGLASEAECADTFDEPPLNDLDIKGGKLRFAFDPIRSALRITTTYHVPRELKKEELNALVEATTTQWSDGIGSGSFESFHGEVLSTSLAQAILNSQPNSGDLGEFFVDAYPVFGEEEPVIETVDSEDDDDGDLRYIQEAAGFGDVHAQYVLARHLQDGDGIAKDASLAIEYYQKATDQGHLLAPVFLGLCYQRGTGVTVDLKKAAELFRAAAQKGVPLGMHCLGEAYLEGKGIEQNADAGIEWYQRGVDLGDVGCTAELGECYEYGKGVPQDLHNALALYQKCMDDGFDAVKPAITRVKKQLKSAK